MVRADNLLMIRNTLSCAKAPVSPGQCVHSMNTPFFNNCHMYKLDSGQSLFCVNVLIRIKLIVH